MKSNKWMCLVLSLMLCLFVLPAGASGTIYRMTEEIIIPDVDLPDNDELFAMYAQEQLYGDSGISVFSVGDRSAGAQLTGDEKLAYDALVPYIKLIAAGTRSSAKIAVGEDANVGNDNGSTTVYQAEEKVIFEETADAFDSNSVLSALLLDYPYEMYWFDKTTGMSIQRIYNTERLVQAVFSFAVAQTYKDNDIYLTDTETTGAASAVAQNALAVVNENESKSDYEKLIAYRDYVCGEVSYDHDAASSSYTGGYGDPWQLIYVFDGNTSTNVVCEGYAKAFQYLCDLTVFAGDISCYSVSGVMAGGTGAGNHMWNIVTMEDGKNYLVDITNSDEETVGSQGGLFLDAPASGGSIAAGYTFNISGQSAVSFTYDDNTKMIWGTDADSILKLADSAYTEDTHTHNWSFTASQNVITAICGGEGTCSIENKTATVTVTGGTHTYDGNAKQATVTQEPTNTFSDVAVSYSPEPVVNADNYTVTIKLGDASATDTLTIEKADGPAAPTVTGNYALAASGNTYTYTVNAIEGAEYRMDDGAWQDSPVFEGIAPNSTHAFCARIKETANANAGAEGTTGSVTFDKLPGSGSVSITGWTYGQPANEPVPASSTNGTESVTYSYESTDGEGYSSATAPKDAGSYKLTATFAANDTYGACAATAEFVIAKAVPTATEPSNLTATYGDTLGSVTLTDGWAWNDAQDTSVGDAGNRNFKATYTHPTEPNNYETIEADLTIAVAPKPITATVTVAEGVYVYNGQAHEPAVTVKDGETVIAQSEYSVEYSDNINAGTAKAIVKDKDGGNYVVSGEGTFVIVQSATDMTAQADKAEYTYGETITVTATGSATGSKPAAAGFALLRSLIAPASNQMALYLGDTQISSAVSAGENGVYTMTYNTADKALTIGSHTLTVRYVGNDDKADASATVKVTLNRRALTVDSVTAESRTYEPGSTQVKVESVTIGNVITGDDVRASAATGEVGSADAGTYSTAALSVTLSGSDAAFYEIESPVTAAVNVTISPKTVTADVSTEQPNYVYTGGAIAPAVVVRDGSTVIPPDEYTAAYSNNVNVGEATITISDRNGGNYVVSGTGGFVIDRAKVTIAADSLSAFVGQAMPKLTYRVTGLIGGDRLTTEPSISCNPDMSKAGTYSITVSGAEAGGNYEIAYQSGVLYVVTADAEGVVTKINQQSLTQVPPGLLDTAFDTVDKIIAEMKRTLVNEAQGYTAANTAHYDVKLQFSLDGGKSWIDATEENFPSEGIRVRIAYPKGTSRYSHDFMISHMFTTTSERLGTVAGETEQPPITKLDSGLEVTLTGLSPVSVAWKPLANASDIESLPKTGDDSSIMLWLALCAAGMIGMIVLKRFGRRGEN